MSPPINLQSKINGLVAPDLLRVMLLDMANIASSPGKELELSRFLGERFAGIGMEIKSQNNEGGDCGISATLRGDGGGRTLLLHGCLANEAALNGSSVPKRAGLFDGEWIYGDGVSNMKCAFVVYLGAMKAIRQSGLRLRGDIVMVGFVAGTKARPVVAADAAVAAQPTGLRMRRSRALAANGPLGAAFEDAHRAVFFGRSAEALEGGGVAADDCSLFNDAVPMLAYGPGGIDREGQYNARDRELGEVVSVPNLVMCAKAYALAAVDFCGADSPPKQSSPAVR